MIQLSYHVEINIFGYALLKPASGLKENFVLVLSGCWQIKLGADPDQCYDSYFTCDEIFDKFYI